jgi:glutamate-5-semialdehyde dehydrogenase
MYVCFGQEGTMVEVPVKLYLLNLAKNCKAATRAVGLLPAGTRQAAIESIAERLQAEKESIMEANVLDADSVAKHLDREAGKEAVKRVRFTAETVEEITDKLRQIAALTDPVGAVSRVWRRPNGIEISRVRVPLGVIGIISELGPVHTLETVALCLKSGNACILRVGPDWGRTHQAIMALLCEAVEAAGFPRNSVSFVERSEKEAAVELMRQTAYLDGLVAVGGPGLRKAVTEQARIPVLCAGGGVSHVYIDGEADLPLAQNIIVNSKVQDPTQANAVDTLLVHQNASRALLPGLIRRLLEEFKIAVRGCPVTMSLAGTSDFSHYASVKPVSPSDWGTQFLDKTLAVKVVKDLDEALEHIARHGPGLVDVIVTRDYSAAMRFTREVDSTGVLVNTSTRLHEGEEYGLGGHIGMSLNRLHARGPVGLEQLMCEKYVVMGAGQLRHPHPVPSTYEDAIMLKRGGGF